MSDVNPQRPSRAEAFRFWLKLGFISFGGPTGQIAIMHSELVEKRKWISEEHFLHALNYCMLLPGPEATQLATYIGWLLHKTWGGVMAGALFVLPSAFILFALSWVYVTVGHLSGVAAVFYGLKPAVVGIVAAALIRISTRALKSPLAWVIAVLAFVAIQFLKAPFPVIVLGAAAIGFLAGKLRPERVSDGNTTPVSTKDRTVVAPSDTGGAPSKPSIARSIRLATICTTLWWAPVLIAAMLLGRSHTVVREGIFFSKAAMVTFGGAYAVLPYVSQQAVEKHGWLTAPQMLDGLGLAETTPGPLIMVLQFVGFLGGWNHPGSLPPLLAATLGAAMATWTTFVPCFLWILVGAPYVERWRGLQSLNAALAAVTAAVVGVILNLAVWFAGHALIPADGRVDWFAVLVSTVTFVGLWRFKWNLLAVVFGSAVAGVVWKFAL